MYRSFPTQLYSKETIVFSKFIQPMTIKKLDMILENKVAQKLKFKKNHLNKKWSYKIDSILIFDIEK